MAQDTQVPATDSLFDRVIATPAVQNLVQRLESGGALSALAIAGPAQPFFAALLQQVLPRRPIMVVTFNLKAQESFQQDLETWMRDAPQKSREPVLHSSPSPLFFPAWDVLPHEDKLPHADTISDRLQTLVALATGMEGGSRASELIVTSVTALL